LIFLIVFLTMGLIAFNKISPSGFTNTAAVVAIATVVAVVNTTGAPGK
tara:strand:+ start:733 stop:876 length:144 start_codon:yes stop_codon:yes gene_type:complete